MQSARRRRSTNFWPGYVDALSTLVMVVIFVLLVFMIAQYFLSSALSGRDAALARLTSQLNELTELLALEQDSNEELRSTVSRLASELQLANQARDSLSAQLAALVDSKGKLEVELAEAQQALVGNEKELTEAYKVVAADKETIEAQLAELALLQSLVEQMDADLAALNQAGADKDERIAELEAQLAIAQAALATARQEAEAEAASLAQLQVTLEESRSALEESQSALAESEATLEERAAALAANEEALTAAEKELALRLAALEAAKQALADSEEELAALRAAAQENENALAESFEELTALREALVETRKRLEAAEQRLAEALARAATAEAQLVTQGQDLEEVETAAAASEAALAEQTALSEAARRQVELLNAQLVALRQQLARLAALLEATEAKNLEQEVEIANLGQRLNEALATKVQELARYRSEFFGRLREVLGDREDIRIVGDRFVFQSEVLFESGQAALGEAGRAQIASLARTLQEIIPLIPPEIDWVLQVNGHTDIRPVVNSPFASNWELSQARALSVVRVLIVEGIPPERLVAAGYAEFQPLDSGLTDEAFRLNRRIEIKLTER